MGRYYDTLKLLMDFHWVLRSFTIVLMEKFCEPEVVGQVVLHKEDLHY